MSIDLVEVEFPPGIEVASMRLFSPNKVLITGREFQPSDISGLQFWIKGDGVLWQDQARTIPVTANDDRVAAWDDASGNGRHVTTSASDNTRPVYKTAVQGGEPGVQWFDGDTASVRLIATPASVTYSALDFFLVAKRSETGDNHTFFDIRGGIYTIIGQTTGNGTVARTFTSGTNLTITGSDTADTNWNIWELRWDGANSDFFKNNANIGTGAATGNSNGITQYNVGRSADNDAALRGTIGEMFFYNQALSVADKGRVIGYLTRKWGISA